MRRYLSISCCKDKHFFSNTKSFCQKNSCPLKTLPFISYVLIHQCFGKKQKILVHGLPFIWRSHSPPISLLFIHICIGNTIGNEFNAFNA